MFGFESLSSTTRAQSYTNLAFICFGNCHTISHRMLMNRMNIYFEDHSFFYLDSSI